MKTLFNSCKFSRRNLFAAALAAVSLGVVLNAHAISGWFIGDYRGTLKFPNTMVSDCALLQPGDEAAIHVTTGILGAEYRYYTKRKSNLGIGTFTGTTTSGVPVEGQGKISGNYDSATIIITDLIVGDPAGDYCAFTGLNIKANVVR